ncbi:VOC family protein [Termitidicoccus mucosus]|uniref:Glyoxalase n=1 Tax=Termitidicoccus mucosus TaxID=1184151 RepID=A0A178IPW4_9BACT|nr:glyoxalase [Opitutaceae bacterium TSB47]
MSKKVTPIPEGYHTVTPYLTLKNAAEGIAFYKQVFGAKELLRFAAKDGTVGHAEIQVGDSRIMLSDEFSDYGALGPKTLGGTPVSLMVYVEDADALFDRAVAAGAKVLMPMTDEFYGDRCGKVEDPFGHKWMLATHKEDVPAAELNARGEKLFGMSLSVGE